MDDERKNENAQENDFESQLAELIKQSGGVVPPKKKPEPTPSYASDENIVVEPVQSETAQSGAKTPEEVEAEIEAMIDEMSGGNRSDYKDGGMGAESGFAPNDTGAAFVMPEEGDKAPSGSDSLEDIMAEIARLEKETAQAENEQPEESAAESAKLDDELEAMLRSMNEQSEPTADTPPVFEMPSDNSFGAESEPVLTEQAEKEASAERKPLFDIAADEELERKQKEREEELSREAAKTREEAEAERLRQEREEEQAQKAREAEQTQIYERPEIVPPVETHEEREPIDVGHFDKVKEEKPQPDIAAMEAMLQQLLNEDKAKKDEESHAVVSEMEQMRAKIASLEYMLAQKNDETKAQERVREKEREQESPKARPTAQQIIEKAAEGGASTGDINSMFKQWFDLEMAAKMKNIITEDEKKTKGTATASQQPTGYDKSPAVVYSGDADQSSDFIKLSDNVYYNVREKKTYVMRELKPTVRKAVKPAPKKKAAPKKAAHRRRPMHARPGMRPHRPRRPLSPRRRP